MASLFKRMTQNRRIDVISRLKPIQIFKRAIEGKRIEHLPETSDIKSVIQICSVADSDAPKQYFDDVVDKETDRQAILAAYAIRKTQMGVRLKFADVNFKRDYLA